MPKERCSHEQPWSRTLQHYPSLARTRQAEEGHKSPTANGQKRHSSATVSCHYSLRSSWTQTSTWETGEGPGVRPATYHGKATKTGSRRNASHGGGQKSEDRDARIAQATKPFRKDVLTEEKYHREQATQCWRSTEIGMWNMHALFRTLASQNN